MAWETVTAGGEPRAGFSHCLGAMGQRREWGWDRAVESGAAVPGLCWISAGRPCAPPQGLCCSAVIACRSNQITQGHSISGELPRCRNLLVQFLEHSWAEGRMEAANISLSNSSEGSHFSHCAEWGKQEGIINLLAVLRALLQAVSCGDVMAVLAGCFSWHCHHSGWFSAGMPRCSCYQDRKPEGALSPSFISLLNRL